jgi:hypothetical protein
MLPFISLLIASLCIHPGRASEIPPGDKSAALEPKRIFKCNTSSPVEFEKLARTAAELGATHVFVSDLPKSIWQWRKDLSDPYPNWGMMHASIFKVICPPELAAFLPAEYNRRNLQILTERCRILKSFNLKAAFSGCEPAWFTEEVYAAHPYWRGPRCDHTRRSTRAYYAPCIDNPEVLSLYRRSVAELCRQAPIEYFQFLTNDSGGGICWSNGLYPGPNGPESCKTRTFAERTTGFLGTIQEGAADAGFNAEVSIAGSIPDFEADSAVPLLKPGQVIQGRAAAGRVPAGSVGFFYDFYESDVYPVLGIPQPFRVARQLEAADPRGTIVYSLPSVDSTELPALIRKSRTAMWKGLSGRVAALRELAAGMAGEAHADDLLQAWDSIDRCLEELSHMNEGGPILLLGCVNQRWLVRPLVPFPLELKPEEKDYFRRFQFQAKSETEAADLMNLQDNWMIKGFSGRYLAETMFTRAIKHTGDARVRIAAIAGAAPSPAVEKMMRILESRLAMLACVIRNALNTCRFQEILDRTDYSKKPEESPVWHLPADPRGFDIRAVMRAEIDNSQEMIRLLESAPGPLIETAGTAGDEDIFLLNPDLAGQLRRKIKIMLAHERDYDRLFSRSN